MDFFPVFSEGSFKLREIFFKNSDVTDVLCTFMTSEEWENGLIVRE